MDAQVFVSTLKQSVDRGADDEFARLCGSIPSTAPSHLLRFAALVRALSAADQRTANDLLRFIAEGSLFRVLVYLDNMSQFTNEPGQFELWHVADNGTKTLINDPDGGLLNDMFNNL